MFVQGHLPSVGGGGLLLDPHHAGGIPPLRQFRGEGVWAVGAVRDALMVTTVCDFLKVACDFA